MPSPQMEAKNGHRDRCHPLGIDPLHPDFINSAFKSQNRTCLLHLTPEEAEKERKEKRKKRKEEKENRKSLRSFKIKICLILKEIPQVEA